MTSASRQGKRGYLAFLWLCLTALLVYRAVAFGEPWVGALGAITFVMFLVRLYLYVTTDLNGNRR